MTEPAPGPIRAVLFDLDGTLIDTAPDMAQALNDLLAEEGRPPLAFEAIRPHVSKGSTGLLDLAYGAEQAPDERERLRERFLQRYRADLASFSRPFPGMEALLADLEEAGIGWGIVTNKPGWLAEPLLQTLRLDTRCACLVSGDTLTQRKPHPAPLLYACRCLGVDPRTGVYVGDDERDVAAGRAAGIATYVALFGYLGTGDRPDTWGADGMLTAPGDLWNALIGAGASRVPSSM